jgi:hypothetical protein
LTGQPGMPNLPKWSICKERKMQELRMKKILCVLLLFLVPEVYARDNFKIPKNWGDLPISYLEELRIENPSRKLSQSELKDLCRLFMKAHVTTRREYKQDFNMDTKTPVYRLLKANLPDIGKYESESGRIMFLGTIFNYLWSLPEYRKDGEQIIREGPFKKEYCSPLTFRKK